MAPDSLICRIQNKYFAIIENEDKKIEKKKIQNPKSIKGEKLQNVHALHCTYSTTGLGLLEVWS